MITKERQDSTYQEELVNIQSPQTVKVKHLANVECQGMEKDLQQDQWLTGKLGALIFIKKMVVTATNKHSS